MWVTEPPPFFKSTGVEVEAGQMKETLQLKSDLTVNEACCGKNVGNWQTASCCYVFSSQWFGEGKGKEAGVTKCSSRAAKFLTYTAAVHPGMDISAGILMSHFC